ncbi:YfjI family protein, partial [Bacteroides sp.]|uniref:YfjI family protein n=1 Tax=Bacteroides sp. TaxID=29523 RepID=UPI003AAE29A1
KKHEEEEKQMKGTEPLSPLPYFPQDHDWPEPLKSILSFAKTPAQHDVLLLGAMTVLGASLSHIVRCKYGDKWQYPCLQTFITGHAAAGKSVLVWVRKLIEPIHEEIRRQVAESMKVYRKELRAYEALGKARKDKEPPVAPPNRMFIIPGNNTGTGLLQNLIDSDGTGIICESEADTVSTAIGTEFGNWSDTLRKAFDHDRLSYNRRTDREYKETTACYLSVLLSGTPAQIKPLISSPENGQFSRNIFYYMPRVGEWKDQFGEDELDVEAEFIRMGHEWKASRDELKKKGLFTLKFTRQQKDEFNGHFSALFYRSSLVTGEEMSASVMRMGTILCRMMCITALLRSLEIPSLAVPDPTINPENLKDGIITRHNLSITDEDFRAVLALCEPLYLHATHILSFLDKSTELNSRGIADREMLYASLPQEFTKQMVMEQAEKLNIPVNTARSWIQRLREKGALDMVMVKGKGVYSKKQR